MNCLPATQFVSQTDAAPTFFGLQPIDSTAEEISFLAHERLFSCLPMRLDLRAIDRGPFLA
jgi:hypothetical protein